MPLDVLRPMFGFRFWVAFSLSLGLGPEPKREVEAPVGGSNRTFDFDFNFNFGFGFDLSLDIDLSLSRSGTRVGDGVPLLSVLPPLLVEEATRDPFRLASVSAGFGLKLVTAAPFVLASCSCGREAMGRASRRIWARLAWVCSSRTESLENG